MIGIHIDIHVLNVLLEFVDINQSRSLCQETSQAFQRLHAELRRRGHKPANLLCRKLYIRPIRGQVVGSCGYRSVLGGHSTVQQFFILPLFGSCLNLAWRTHRFRLTQVKIMDDDGSKSLNMAEFKKAMKECTLDLNGRELEALFKHFDKDGNGSISLDEIKETLGISDEDGDELRKLINDIDENGDGEIQFEEFCNMMQRLTT
mgnify:CR=1 FL=1